MILKDRVALVTGGGTGIGKAIARAFSENGARVAICGRTFERLRRTADEFRAEGREVLALKADVTQRAEVRRAVEETSARWGHIHVLVNNAGINARVPIDSEDEARWLAVIQTNLVGMYSVTKEVLPRMPDHAGGRIINVSSVLGRIGAPAYTAYCAAKHGVIGFTRALALEVVDRGITVNALCPGWVETEMAAQGMRETAAALGATPQEFREEALAAVPIKRILDPKEVADLALYLASDASRGMTGQALNICGGQVMS